MFDVTAGRSAGTPRNEELDPTRAVPAPRSHPNAPADEPVLEELRDVTAGRSAGTAWNAAKDPTRAASPADVRR